MMIKVKDLKAVKAIIGTLMSISVLLSLGFIETPMRTIWFFIWLIVMTVFLVSLHVVYFYTIVLKSKHILIKTMTQSVFFWFCGFYFYAYFVGPVVDDAFMRLFPPPMWIAPWADYTKGLDHVVRVLQLDSRTAVMSFLWMLGNSALFLLITMIDDDIKSHND